MKHFAPIINEQKLWPNLANNSSIKIFLQQFWAMFSKSVTILSGETFLQ